MNCSFTYLGNYHNYMYTDHFYISIDVVFWISLHLFCKVHCDCVLNFCVESLGKRAWTKFVFEKSLDNHILFPLLSSGLSILHQLLRYCTTTCAIMPCKSNVGMLSSHNLKDVYTIICTSFILHKGICYLCLLLSFTWKSFNFATLLLSLMLPSKFVS